MTEPSFRQIVADYIITCRGSGHSLPYSDHKIIDAWISQSSSEDDLILTLEDILPEYFAKAAEKSVPPTLRAVNKRILARLRERSMKR